MDTVATVTDKDVPVVTESAFVRASDNITVRDFNVARLNSRLRALRQRKSDEEEAGDEKLRVEKERQQQVEGRTFFARFDDEKAEAELTKNIRKVLNRFTFTISIVFPFFGGGV